MKNFVAKDHLRIATFIAALIVVTSTAVSGQAPQALTAGLSQERMLGPGERHEYTVSLKEGEGIIGEADQHGVDLVIDEYDADGKLIRTVDSPNGTEGPEPIDLTAFTTGQYRLVIHVLDPNAKPGRYVMKIDQILTAEQNGSRMAEKNYPPAIQDLWRKYVVDPKAVEDFVAGRKGKGPIVEDIKDDNKNVNVTFLYLGDENTQAVEIYGSTRAGTGGTRMERFLRTRLFFATETVPKDSRFSYGFMKTETRVIGPKGNIELSDELDVPDPLNPQGFNSNSVLELPNAPPQQYIVASDSVPHGKLAPVTLKSTSLKEDRNLTIYTPPNYDAVKAANLLIVFDGGTYDGGGASLIPTPTILDNLIAGKKIGPVVAVFVNNKGDQRSRDLGGYDLFADFIVNELIPWVRKSYRIQDGKSHVILAGSSRGGVAAAHCAFYHSDVIGNVLSQSGAFFVRNDPDEMQLWPITQDTGDIVTAYRESPRLPIKFYMEVGRFDASGAILGNNRELRDVLLLKGYSVDYHEFDGGHDYLWWRGSLADGLIALLGSENLGSEHR
jgi:enterochelin esterase-like enzyme